MIKFPDDYALKNGIYLPSITEQSVPFAYSDGEEFESRIANVIATARDRTLFSRELRDAIWDWRSACHLSPVRANILRPLESICRGRVLELGSGCGIVTRYLGELGGDVVALEASELRASITRERTLDLNNVNVVCERIENFSASAKFDVVTMIGVLQYARQFASCGERAEQELLRNAVRQLSDDGVLVIAIQNKLSLKSLAGYPEANAGVPYFGVENRYGNDSIIRFGLDELKGLLAECGVPYHAFLAPLPDYHMPITILNEKAMLPTSHFRATSLLAASVGRDRVREDWTRPMFSLERAWESVHSAGATPYLANAFLIVAGRTEHALAFQREMEEFAWHYSVERHAAFATEKRFVPDGEKIRVEVKNVSPMAVPEVPLTHRIAPEAYVEGRTWWEVLVEILNRPGWSIADIASWVDPWLSLLGRLSGNSDRTPDQEMSGALFDCTPLNCIRREDGELVFIDREWELKFPVTLSFLMLRGLYGSFVTVSSCAPPAPGVPVLIMDLIQRVLWELGIVISEDDIAEFSVKEKSIQNCVLNGEELKSLDERPVALTDVALDCRVLPRELAGIADSLRSDVRSLEFDYEELLAEYRRGQATTSRLITEFEDAQTVSKSRLADFELLQEDYQKLLAEYEACKEDNSEFRKNFETLQVDYKVLLDAYRIEREQAVNRANEFSKLKIDYGHIFSEYSSVKESMIGLSASYQQLQSDRERLVIMYEDLQEIVEKSISFRIRKLVERCWILIRFK